MNKIYAIKRTRKQDEQFLSNFSTVQILDSLPENIMLVKDSGRWMFLTGGMDADIVASQEVEEGFPNFVKRYALGVLQGGDQTLREVLAENLCVVRLGMEVYGNIGKPEAGKIIMKESAKLLRLRPMGRMSAKEVEVLSESMGRVANNILKLKSYFK